MQPIPKAEEIRLRYRNLRNVSVEEIVDATKIADRRARWVLRFLVGLVGSAVVWAVWR